MHNTDDAGSIAYLLKRPNKPATGDQLWSSLVLAHLPGLSSRCCNHLLSVFGSPDQVLNADRDALLATGLDASLAALIRKAADDRLPVDIATAVATALRWSEQANHTLLPMHAPEYPALLRDIPDPPPLLYVQGQVDILQKTMLAMVGSRRPTVDGRRNARWFAGELCAAGLGISSGLAMGIDAESHVGALERQGKTVAVLGTGIDVVYPACNKTLYDRLAETGVIMSEFNPGIPPRPEHFPRRNRIISGLSLGVLVVEASLKSGSMITARFALEQGRDVFAIPGSIHNPMTRGCHRLIHEGARLVETASDILEECAQPFRATAGGVGSSVTAPDLQGELATVLAAIGSDPVFPDVVMRETGLLAATVSASLVELELLDLVHQQPGGGVRRRGD